MMHETSVLAQANDRVAAIRLPDARRGRAAESACPVACTRAETFPADDQSFHDQIKQIIDRFSAEDGQSDFDYIVGFSNDAARHMVMAIAVTATVPWRATRWSDCQQAIDDLLTRRPVALVSDARRSA